MPEEVISRKKIFFLFLAGGTIVATTFVVGLVFGVATWTSWWIANFLHLIGGAYAFYFTRAIFYYTRPYHKTSAAPWMETIFFVAGAIVLGVWWEWYELAIDRYHVLVLGERSIMTYADNIGDLVIDALGAAAAALYEYKKYAKRK